MQNAFEILQITRQNTLTLLDDLTLDQLNEIPEGYSNSIIWNVAHVVTTQQLLCYGLSNNEKLIAADRIDQNRKGTKPERYYSEEEVAFWKEQMIYTAGKIKEDYSAGIFKEFNEYTTSYNITLTDIEKAIEFNNVHEGVHYGYILALRKSIKDS